MLTWKPETSSSRKSWIQGFTELQIRKCFVLRQLLNEIQGYLLNLLQGNTPLHIAVQFDIKELSSKSTRDADLCLQGEFEWRQPLHVAARCGHLSTIDFLVREVLSAERIRAENGETGKFDMLRQETSSIFSSWDQRPDCLHAAVMRAFSRFFLIVGFHMLLNLKGLDSTLYAAFLGDCKAVGRLLELDKLLHMHSIKWPSPFSIQTRILRWLIWDERVDHRARNENGQSVFDIDESIRETCFTYRCNIMTCIWRKLASVSNRITGKRTAMQTEAIADPYKRMGNTLLLVATLIATVTFAAAFTMPGGFNNARGPMQGVALLESSKRLRWFIFSDAIAMTSSIIAACIIFWGAVINDESYVYYLASATVLTCIALESAAIAFLSGIAAALPDQPFVDRVFYIVGISFHVSVFLFVLQLARIFNVSEICQFLIFCFWKMKSRINK
uniref:PGG domain-containing protein n=1 Tax=Salix viminalis TaxID=40686 RepID=A0A6N2MRK0_SALVM